MANLTFQQLENLWTKNGGPPEWAATMAAVALAESSGNPQAKNASGATGLWQTIMGAQGQPFQQQYGSLNLTNPDNAAKVAIAQLHGGAGITNWTADHVGKYVTEHGSTPLTAGEARSMSNGGTTSAQSAAEAAINKALGVTSSATGSGLTHLTLPDAQTLEANGLSKAEAKKLAGKKVPVSVESSTGRPSGTDLLTAVNGLTSKYGEKEARAVAKSIGLDDPNLGTTLDSRASTIVTYLPTDGDLGRLTPAAMSAVSSTEQALKSANAALTSTSAALSAGNEAARTGATVSAQYSAEANADSELTNWGLDTPEMDSLVSKLVASGVTNTNEILQNLRQTATYQKAFPGLAEYNSKPGQIHMTESEYRTYSQALQSSAQQYGGVKLNQGQVSKLLNGNVSASEFQQRTQDIGVAVANADQTTKNLLQEQYGINPNHLFAYYANPKEALPDMQRAVASGEIQDYAARVGLGGLTTAGAGQLADMAKLSATQGNNLLGVGVSNIQNSLLTASRDSALLKSNPGAETPSINTNTLIGSQLAGFGGTNQEAAQIEVGRAEGARAAPFDKGGGYSETNRGVAVGSSPT